MPATTPASPPEPPRDEDIRAKLGDVFPLYHELLEDPALVPEWKYYGAKYGWSLKLFEKKRNLCFINPKEGLFDVAFIYGDRAVQEALAASPRADIEALLRGARHYPEGWGVRVTVGSEAELGQVRLLLAIKRAG